jgi:hypothetical protein
MHARVRTRLTSVCSLVQAPIVRAPFVLLPSYAAPWQQHSLLPGAGSRAVLPVGECAVLAASLRAEGDVTIRAISFDVTAGWEFRVRCGLVTASCVHG